MNKGVVITVILGVAAIAAVVLYARNSNPTPNTAASHPRIPTNLQVINNTSTPKSR